MAKPRVFISSTFYDLKYIRNEIESFVRRMGYDPILNERGRIAYPGDRKLDESCYQEVENCDMLVAIIGGRWGSASTVNPQYSISQEELRRAHKKNKQIFVFVENPVFHELQTYRRNKGKGAISYYSVDSEKIFEFIEEIESLSRNNAISRFESADDITSYLREQWAGMMYEMLQNIGKTRDFELTQRLESTVSTLERAVKEIGAERSDKNFTLLAAHPIFGALKSLLKVRYRVFFTSHSELSDWLIARSFTPVPNANWDDEDFEEWIKPINNDGKTYDLLKIRRDVFDAHGSLNVDTVQSWNDNWAQCSRHSPEPVKSPGISDDDIPF